MGTDHEADEYLIKVAGVLDPGWAEWFDGLEIKPGIEGQNQPVSLLSGRFEDQAHLRGILTRIWDLNLKVISVSLIPGKPLMKKRIERRSKP
jgi:hypothetical protein